MTDNTPRLYIAPPDVEPYAHGLFGAAQPLSTDDIHWLAAGVEWESLAEYASQPYAAGIFAGAGGGGSPATKSLDTSVGTSKAWPFAVYAGVACGSIGYTAQEFEDRTRRILELSAQHEVEAALWNGAGVNPAATLLCPPLNGFLANGTTAAATKLNTSAVSLVAALTLCENWAAANYAGQAQIHAQRGVAAVADSYRLVHLDQSDDSLRTRLETRWVFGGGYDGTGPGQAAVSGTNTWIYVTGQTIIGHGPVELPANYLEAIQRTTNELFLISEQPWIVGADGAWAAALVDLSL